MNLVKVLWKKFFNRLKYEEKVIVCLCKDVLRLSDVEDPNEKFDVLTKTKSQKVNQKNVIIEKQKKTMDQTSNEIFILEYQKVNTEGNMILLD